MRGVRVPTASRGFYPFWGAAGGWGDGGGGGGGSGGEIASVRVCILCTCARMSVYVGRAFEYRQNVLKLDQPLRPR